jgi:hypothetical protein
MEQHKAICPDRIEKVKLSSNSQKQQLDRQWAIVNSSCCPITDIGSNGGVKVAMWIANR